MIRFMVYNKKFEEFYTKYLNVKCYYFKWLIFYAIIIIAQVIIIWLIHEKS